MFLRFVSVVAYLSTLSLSWLNNNPFFGYTMFRLSTHHLMDMGCFCLLAVMKKAVMYIHIHVFVRTCVFISLGYMAKIGIAGSYGNTTFTFTEELPDCFPKGKNVEDIPSCSLHHLPHLLLSLLFITALLVGVLSFYR